MQDTGLKQALATLGARRHLAALALILVCCALLFGWFAAAYLPDAADRSERQIVNDDYATLTQPLAAGEALRQSLVVRGRLYGVQLNVATFGRVAKGTLSLELLDESGAVVAANSTPMEQLLDNTFHRFLFNQAVEPAGSGNYTLVITAAPETGGDAIAFHRSDGPAESYSPSGGRPAYDLAGFELSQNGQAVDGTLALQYVTRYAGGFVYRAFSFFAAFITVALLALYVLVFVLRAPEHRVFTLGALCLGFVFLFLIPPRTAPDEYVHITAAYRYANKLVAPADWPADTEDTLYLRRGDTMELATYTPDATGIWAYQELYEGLFKPDGGNENPRDTLVRSTDSFFPSYLAPTLGVVLARIFGLGKAGLLLLGRGCNLLLFTLLVGRAIKRMPFAKPLMLCAGLLPMCLQLAASFSPDVYVIGLCFYFTACCLDYAFNRAAIGGPQVALLCVLAALIAPAKAVYLLLLGLVLIIPAARYATRRTAWAARAVVLACALVMWGLFSIPAITTAAGMNAGPPPAAEGAAQAEAAPPAADEATPAQPEEDAEPQPPKYALVDGEILELRHNGDAIQQFTPKYALTHLPKTLKLLARSLWENSALWLQGLVGGRLGEISAVNIEVNWLFTIGLAACLGLAALRSSADGWLPAKKQRAALLLPALLVCAAFLLACLMWTPANYLTLFGVQGRYFLPVLPALLLGLRGKTLKLERPVWRQLALATAALAVCCQLDAFRTIITL